MIYNGFIYCKSLNKIINIEYDTAHPLYYWYRYVVYLIHAEESTLKKEIEENVEKEIKESVKEEKRKLLNNFKINKSINFLFVLEEDVQDSDFYKALSFFLKKESNRKPLISIGTFGLNNIETYLPVYYLDSSIWNYYINVLGGAVKDGKQKLFSEMLSGSIKNIITNYTKHLYSLTVANEFVEFQDRLLGNSYLDLPGGHAASVVPFVFHSETQMQKESLKIENNIQNLLKVTDTKKNSIENLKEKIKDIIEPTDDDNDSVKKIKQNINTFIESKSDNTIRWNILLIDDYGNKALKGGSQNKNDIFNQILPDTIFKKGSGIDHHIINLNCNVVVSESIEDALEKIKPGKSDDKEKMQFDIILLDYLLGKKNDGSNNREYGDEFLHKLENDNELLKKRGPLGKFWILPISSFSNAMLSKLEEEGIGRISDNWYIMDGADMINTPNLFIYNFLKLIYLQLNTAIVTIEDIAKFIIENKQYDANGLKSKEGEENEDVIYITRQNARRLYGIFMHKFGLRGALRNDEKQGSAFAESVRDYMYKERTEDLRFYENVRKLLYLVGYATHSDSALMWDLLTHISSVVASTKFKSGEIDKKQVNSFLKKVQEYISGLKNNNG